MTEETRHPDQQSDEAAPAEPGPSDTAAWGWWAGSNEEWFERGGPFATRGEAIEAGREDGDGFWIVEAVPHVVRFSAKRLIDEQYFEAEDWFSYDNGSDPDRLKGSEEADAELQALLDVWTKKWRHTFAPPTTFRAQRNLEWIAPDEEAGE